MNRGTPHVRHALFIALVYALFGSLWIIVSDRLLGALVSDPIRLTEIQTYKGWLFVAASSLLIYVSISSVLRTRAKAEEALRESEEKYRSLIQTANDAIVIADAGTGMIIDVNRKVEDMLGIPADQLIGTHHSGLFPAEEAGRYVGILEKAAASGRSIYGDIFLCCREGWRIPAEVSANIIESGGRKLIQGVFRDMTEHIRIEQALQRERDRAQQYLNVAGVIILVLNRLGRVELINRKGCELLGYAEAEIVGKNWVDNFLPEERRKKVNAVFYSLMTGEAEASERLETPVVTRGGETKIIAWHNTVLRDGKGNILGTLSSGEDVTARKRAEEQARYRLQRLAALHSIDVVISSSLDLRLTLQEFLEQVISQLQVDAADVLLVTPYTVQLEETASRGFRGVEGGRSILRMGEGIAGKAALERKSVSIPDLQRYQGSCPRMALLAREGFISYYAIPLIAKGNVKGVLEIFHRSTLVFDTEWLDFLEALAGLAAIAIDNATLFEDLQRSNIELTLAYDETLAGWAKALDLRSKETERHTERVTEMTLRLAKAMSIRDEELMHVRRGALLHDIGKIGVPDGILLKPGPLTDEEWEIMKRHPVYAFEMLQPIAYLRYALDIPYCHHERWDGTGYPRGLKAEKIPLAARIFAVVDVWDALVAEGRPYREILPEDEVREHIRSLSGTHLDPTVVETFLGMEW